MLAAIRVRGTAKLRASIEKTLECLNLKRPNQLVLLPENNESIIGMLKKAENYITWGELKKDVLVKLLKKRARVEGNKKITDKWLEEKGFKSFEELAEKLEKNEITLEKLGIKKVFRMRPPSKGYGRAGIKKPFKVGGALGYRGEYINELIERML